MRSYPNLIPLPAATVIEVADRVTRHPFARIYGGWWDTVIAADNGLVERSAERYRTARRQPSASMAGVPWRPRVEPAGQD